MADPAKRPSKGILKHTSSIDKASNREVEWDEMNILATNHPPDKDYGHMSINEPPTPYNRFSDTEDEEIFQRTSSCSDSMSALDPIQLADRLASADTHCADERSSCDESDEDFETEEERACHMEFERKRKFHYNEFAAVQLAKRLMSEEEDDDEDDRCGALSAISTVDETSTTLSVENAGISVSAGLTDDVCMVSDCM